MQFTDPFLSLTLIATLVISLAPLLLAVPCERIILGNEVLRESGYEPLLGHKVAILTTPAGIFQDSLKSIVDVMAADARLHVAAVLAPEHGFRGQLQAETGDPLVYIDEATQLPVFSVYNMTIPQITNLLVELEITAVLIDLQDVGVRLYTFIWTSFNVQSAVAGANRGIKLVVTDRPNPLGGLSVEGPLMNLTCCASGYGKAEIPFVHGMTVGELSLLFNAQLNMPTQDLIVVEMKNWYRDYIWSDWQQPAAVLENNDKDTDSQPQRCAVLFPSWVPPSPNIPTANTAQAYPATVFLEATTAAEGRGTTTPFELFGAPFIEAEALAVCLNSKNSRISDEYGSFRPAYFQPTFSKYNGTVVPGVQWFTGRTLQKWQSAVEIEGDAVALDLASSSFPPPNALRGAFYWGMEILCAMRDLASPKEAFQWDGSWFGHPGTELIDEYAGTPTLRKRLDAGYSAKEIVASYAADTAAFLKTRKPFLIYSLSTD